MLIPSIDAARNYDHIVVAPHLDDAALSCGGLIAQLVDAGARVLTLTICAGSPPPAAALSPFAQYLHAAWALGDDPIAERRAEDEAALQILGCDGLHLAELDAPYRVAAYGEGDGWRGNVDPADPLIAATRAILARLYDQQPGSRLYVPLGVGNHVDHQIVCAAGFKLAERGADVRWYEDAPYAAKDPHAIGWRQNAIRTPMTPEIILIDNVLNRKLDAIAAYRSQLRELFGDLDWCDLMTAYARSIGGGRAAERVWRY